MFLSMAVRLTHSTLYHHYLPSTSRLLAPVPSPLLGHISFISNMSQSSSTFQALFNSALQDYKDKTGNALIDYPIAEQLQTCDSVDSIATVLQEQAQRFREFSETDGKLMKALNSSVDILCLPSISSALSEAIGFVVRPEIFIDTLFLMAILQPFPPAKAIFTGIGILLNVFISSSDPISVSP
jgi:hypothetical protein